MTTLFVLNTMGFPVHAQNPETGKQEKTGEGDAGEQESFTNFGLISISSRHELSKNRRYVSFTIINNAGRSIGNIFGWVYRYEEDETGKKTNYALANFPHKGGVCEKNMFHKPGQKAKWRFLLKGEIPKEAVPKFLLMINMNSIFFAKTETSEPEPKIEEEEKKPKKPEKKD